MENITKIISGKLKGIRAEKGYTQEEIAEKLGIHRETFRKYENDPSLLEIGQFLKILEIYDVETTYFFSLIYGNLPKEKKEIKVEVVNPKSNKEWEEIIDKINKFLELKYTKKDSEPSYESTIYIK